MRKRKAHHRDTNWYQDAISRDLVCSICLANEVPRFQLELFLTALMLASGNMIEKKITLPDEHSASRNYVIFIIYMDYGFAQCGRNMSEISCT